MFDGSYLLAYITDIYQIYDFYRKHTLMDNTVKKQRMNFVRENLFTETIDYWVPRKL